MAAFEWLEDVDRRVRLKVGQPRDFSGQPTWEEAEFEHAYNKAYVDVRREIGLIDKNFQESFFTATVAAGSLGYTIPPGNRVNAIRLIIAFDADGRQRFLVRTAIPEELGTLAPGVAGIYLPDQDLIRFTDRLTEPLTLTFYHTIWYVPLLHGCAQDGGGSTITLADHSSAEDSLYVGQVIRIVEGPGLGEEHQISAYNGATKVATVSIAWTTPPNNTSRYTTRPVLQWDAKDVFENMSLAALYEGKSDDANQMKFMALAKSTLSRMSSALELKELREPSDTYDQNLYGGYGDPADVWRI